MANKHNYFYLYTNGYKYCDVILKNRLNISDSFAKISIWLIDGTLKGTTILSQSGPGSNINEGYSTFPKAPDWTLTIRWFCLISMSNAERCLTPLQRCNFCIIQTQSIVLFLTRISNILMFFLS